MGWEPLEREGRRSTNAAAAVRAIRSFLPLARMMMCHTSAKPALGRRRASLSPARSAAGSGRARRRRAVEIRSYSLVAT